MKFVLFFAAIYSASGPGAESPRGFDTLADCNRRLAAVVKTVVAYNASDKADKIVTFAAACVPHKIAPKGIES